MEARQVRGLEIARTSRIRRNSNYWIVPSQSGKGTYKVKENGHGFLCNCPDCELRRTKCKHIWAVEYTIRKITDEYGNVTTEKTMKVTYTQDWSAYNKAQMNEKSLFMKLLYDLCNEVPNPEYAFGRPTLPLSDMVFASALKVYTTFSLRRFTSDMREANEKGYIEKVPYYSTVSRYMNKEEMTPILHNLIRLTSLPLASVEHDFAVDSSGFSTTRFARYYSFKHGKDRKYRTWVKCHIACGTKTNVVTGVEITEETASDSPQFKPLVEKTAENFQIGEVSADKAYSSRENHETVGDFGGMAYIPFRTNATGRAGHSALWKKMFHFYNLHRDEFLQHYHKRSNSETVFHMVKTKFGDSVRSREKTAQINEVLLKILCHNIVVLVHEMYEMEINI